MDAQERERVCMWVRGWVRVCVCVCVHVRRLRIELHHAAVRHTHRVVVVNHKTLHALCVCVCVFVC